MVHLTFQRLPSGREGYQQAHPQFAHTPVAPRSLLDSGLEWHYDAILNAVFTFLIDGNNQPTARSKLMPLNR